MEPAEERTTYHSTQELARAGARGARLGGVAGVGQGTATFGIHGVVADGDLDGGARSREPALAVARGPICGEADRKGHGWRDSGPLQRIAQRNRKDGIRSLLGPGVPPLPTGSGRTVRARP